MDLWIASLVALWLVVLLMAFLLAGALRMIGLFQLRLGDDLGALITDAGLNRGVVAPNFSALDIETGIERSFSDFVRSRTMLVFVTPTCLACRQLAPHLNEVIATRPEVQFVVLCTGDFASARAFADRYRIKAPFLVDPSNRLSTEFDVKVTPLAFLLDGERRVLIRGVANDWNQLESLIREEGSVQGGRAWERVDGSPGAAEPSLLSLGGTTDV